MGRNSALCKVFQLLSHKTWYDLRDGYLSGLTISEESITDFLLLDLKRACPNNVRIRKYNKIQEGRTTGADWEWWFVGKGKAFGMRVQAKRLDVLSCNYKELDHSLPRSKQKQVNLLIRDAKLSYPNRYPMYCFYNFWDNMASSPQWRCRSYPPNWELFGCSVCDAHLIKKFIAKGEKSLKKIGSHSFPLMCLVCCTGFSFKNANIAERAHGVACAMSVGDNESISDEKTVPDVIDEKELPSYIKILLDTPDAIYSDTFNLPEGRFLDGIMVILED